MVLESQAEARSGRDEVGHIKDFLSLSNWKAFENFFILFIFLERNCYNQIYILTWSL